MKTTNALLITIVGATLGLPTHAANVYWDSGFTGGGLVPDGNVTGWSDTRTLSGFSMPITDVNVVINLAGGYNGDLYAYLLHDSGFVVLLNRVGVSGVSPFGYGDAGMNVVLDDQASGVADIHFYQSDPLTSISTGAAWMPDGRNISPLSNGALFDATLRQNGGLPLAQYNGASANGSWSLFVADLSNGGQTTVVGWGLQIAVVPEPSSMTLLLAGIAAAAAVRKWRRH